MSDELLPSPSAADLGWKLAQAREMRGISREAVAKAIHLRKHYVDALESGRFELLPGAAYVRGYLQRYAEFLELDAAALIAEFDAMNLATPKKLFALPQTLERNPYPSARLALGGVMVGLLLIAVVSLTRQTTSVSVVKPYDVVSVMPIEHLPHRCMSTELYPPCFWENTLLWYTQSDTKTPIFLIDTHATTP